MFPQTWTPERVKLLKKLVASKERTGPEIAHILSVSTAGDSVSHAAVKSKAQALGLTLPRLNLKKDEQEKCPAPELRSAAAIPVLVLSTRDGNNITLPHFHFLEEERWEGTTRKKYTTAMVRKDYRAAQ